MEEKRKRVFDIIQIGNREDVPSAAFDYFIVVMIFLTLFVTVFDTFDASARYRGLLDFIETAAMLVFLVEFILRLWTADFLYPEKKSKGASILAFCLSFYGLIDFFTIAPFFLPFFLPSGAVAFRILRVIRIFRLFKINAQYDAFNVIIDVLNQKKEQIISSLCMILILMVASSLCMYSLEHEVQPEAFKNAFSGIWWSMSTLLTVGYGDIYPITTAGRLMAIMIAFLGVGLVAIPTGIISAGFVEQFTRMNEEETIEKRFDMRVVTLALHDKHPWKDKKLSDIILPPQMLMPMLLRGKDKQVVVPDKDTVLLEGDTLVLAEKNHKEEDAIALTELAVLDNHPFVDKQLRNLDISRLETVVMIKRKNKMIVPVDTTQIHAGDVLMIYRRKV